MGGNASERVCLTGSWKGFMEDPRWNGGQLPAGRGVGRNEYNNRKCDYWYSQWDQAAVKFQPCPSSLDSWLCTGLAKLVWFQVTLWKKA